MHNFLYIQANVFAGFMRRFSADVNIVLFDRVKLDLCPYKPITATSCKSTQSQTFYCIHS